MPDWDAERKKLKQLVQSGEINNAKRAELLHWRLALANANPPYLADTLFKQENAEWKSIIDKLLEIHGATKAEKLAKRAILISVLAAIFTAFAAIFTGLQALYAYETYRTTSHPSESGKTNTPLESIGTTN